ncbi:MAG: hypothetical protein HY321_07065 [Armatimonadetes bacterium]|nr:hypothetical protein [Armatimonadota bacterium]
MDNSPVTLYQIAEAEIRQSVGVYLALAEATGGLTAVRAEHLNLPGARLMLLAGLGIHCDLPPSQALEEWRRRRAVPFDLESAISAGAYQSVRARGAQLLDQVEDATQGFRTFDPDVIRSHAFFLPVLQHLGGVFSKAALKRLVGAVSDTGISKPAAGRLARLLSDRVAPERVNKGEILKRLESTLEGIIRDVVGRVLLESVVESALRKRSVPFQREDEYSALSGVVYDFRADFVLPDAARPKAFIEVRKSPSRHASLYAKDKMFSAINWKGRNPDLLAVLVIDGEWTRETLRVMANVFDYVVPITRVTDLADIVSSCLRGDASKLKWLMRFSVVPAL